MTLDEAIKHEEELANRESENAEWFDLGDDSSEMFREKCEKCRECAKEHRQLAEWLKELKAYREAYEDIRKMPIVWEFGEGVSRCLTIIRNRLEEVKADADSN